MPERLTIRVITSCTGKKKKPAHLDEPVENPLTLEDFRIGDERLEEREQELKEINASMAARTLYAGQQHKRLMRAVEEIGFRGVAGEAMPELDLWILSAGYGLMPEGKEVAPYESTFRDMRKQALRDWADQLDIPAQVRKVLAKDADLILVLLGDDYWQALDLNGDETLGGAGLFFCGSVMGRTLSFPERATPVVLRRKTAKRFSCGLVGLKGELAARILLWLSEDPSQVDRFQSGSDADVVSLLEERPSSAQAMIRTKGGAGDDPELPLHEDGPMEYESAPEEINRAITLPDDWEAQRRERKIHFFIPDWDDLVDPNYDFENEKSSLSRGGWMGGVYAHQIYDKPYYDGILVSRSTLEKRTSAAKREHLYRYGVHHHLRVPQRFHVMGDCGAFTYADEEEPPFDVEDVIAYYSHLGFDYGVSLDHVATVGKTEKEKRRRMELTLDNADAFLREHRAMGLPWTPIGAIQGWTPETFAEAAGRTVSMGYQYIAIGGVVRMGTPRILRILEAVSEAVPDEVRIHLFGIGRLEEADKFAELGVRSLDSTSPLRRAFLDAKKNYYTLDGSVFAAIRIPNPKRYVDEDNLPEATRLMEKCLEAVRACEEEEDRGHEDRALALLSEYHDLVRPDKPNMREHYEATLKAKPWNDCGCEICEEHGIEVIIFRGNNRNRRRGFHNTYVFYKLLDKAARGQKISLTQGVNLPQHQLFSEAGSAAVASPG